MHLSSPLSEGLVCQLTTEPYGIQNRKFCPSNFAVTREEWQLGKPSSLAIFSFQSQGLVKFSEAKQRGLVVMCIDRKDC
jgi:hypothetical protein